MQWVKWIVHNHHISLRHTQGIVRQSAITHMSMRWFPAAARRWTARGGCRVG
jgi:hypothetical protein